MKYDESPQAVGQTVSKAYSCHDSYTGGDLSQQLFLSGDDALTANHDEVAEGSATYGNVASAPTSYSETSALEGAAVSAPPTDGPGTFVAPVRVPDVTKAVHIELPGVVQRIPAGHRLRVVIAASDTAYNGNLVAQPVTVTTSPDHPSVLRLPVVGEDMRFS